MADVPDLDDLSVSVTLDIAATPERVWQVLTAFDRYPTWHPTMSVKVTVPRQPEVGARLELRLSGGAAGDQEFTAELIEVDAPRRLAWQGGLPEVFFGRHTFELSALPGSGTRFTDTEQWTGSMAAAVVTQHRAVLLAEYTRTAAALKAAAEADQV